MCLTFFGQIPLFTPEIGKRGDCCIVRFALNWQREPPFQFRIAVQFNLFQKSSKLKTIFFPFDAMWQASLVAQY